MPRATLAVLNGRIWTGDPEAPWAEAVLVSDDEILAAGSNADIEPRVEDAQAIDAAERFVAPELWGGELPTREWTDALTPDNPVCVHRLDGRMALANSLALETAGITKDREDIDGGTIERDREKVPLGVLKDNAIGLVDAMMPEPSEERYDRALEAAMDYGRGSRRPSKTSKNKRSVTS